MLFLRLTMPKFTIEQDHALDETLLRDRLNGLNARLAEKYGFSSQWKSAYEATIKGTGASGLISCSENKVTVRVDLSFVLSPMKDRIENRIRRELASALATDDAVEATPAEAPSDDAKPA